MSKPIRTAHTRQVNRLLLTGVLLTSVGCGGNDLQEPSTGGIRITTITSGEMDADGYLVSLDQEAETPMAANATLERSDLPAGSHVIRLAGMADNCNVQGENPRTISISSGETATVEFAVTCSVTTGSLQVTAATAGPSSDPDGYSIIVDGSDHGSVGTNASATFDGVASGDHAVGLTGVAATCVVDGDNPRTVTVPAGGSVTAEFSVTCSTATGGIEVITHTTGSNLDADGYGLAVDAATPQTIDINGTLTLGGLSPGSHTLRLAGIADNCRLEGNSSRTVEVAAGSAAPVTFAVSCAAPAPVPSLIAFTSAAAGLQAIFVVNPDGTGLRRLTSDRYGPMGPVWSPDGGKILFARDDDLYVMNPDGTGQVRLARGERFAEHPVDVAGMVDYRWSPDGSLIAFVVVLRERADIFPELWVMRADGSGKLKLAENATRPTWSPDRRIAFVEGDYGGGPLWVVNADGSGYAAPTHQSVDGDEPPAWSPDGSQIAFVTEDHDITLMSADGTGIINLTNGVSQDGAPTWSPDGRRILFTSLTFGEQGQSGDIAIMDRDGSHRVILTSDAGFDVEPSWSLDGTRIVFTRWASGAPSSDDHGDAEIYVMNSDGSGQVNVSNRPETWETAPDWNGQ
jgi:Tol biopolymer transport system component